MSAHALPMALTPSMHEHGLASRPIEEQAATVDRAWELFMEVVAGADLSAPSGRPGWSGRAVAARVGEWDFTRSIDDLVGEAHDGDADTVDSEATDARVLGEEPWLDDEAVLGSLSRARASASRWMTSDGPATWGLVHTSSPLGPLPVLTVLSAATHQLALSALDLEACGGTVPLELEHIGVTAMVDATGALAARKRIPGSFTAVTPELVVGVGARDIHWRTAVLDEVPQEGPGVTATARTVLQVSSARVNVAHLYRTGEVKVHDLPGLIRLAPVLEGAPGMPPLGAIGRAMQVVDAVGGLLGRLRPH